MADEIKGLLEQQARAFEEMKSKNDDHLKAIEKKFDDVVRRDEVDRISNAISEMSNEVKAVQRAAAISGIKDALNAPEAAEHKQAFGKWLRKGNNEEELAALEAKALSTTTGADGGFAVPEQLETAIIDLVKLISPVRSVARVVTVGTSDYKFLVNLRGTASGWVGETATRPETQSPTLAEVAPPIGEIYANPAATQRMLDDAFFDAEGWLASEIATEFAEEEGIAFITGNGTNRPKGFLDETINVSADGVRTFGHLQMRITGVAGGFKATSTSANPADDFIDVIHSMKAPLRQGASWMMNTLTLASVRKFKDVDGNYIWRPGMAEGAPSTLLGYPVVEAEAMPAVATNTFPIAFGNWARGYTIVDRFGTRTLRDPFTNKPYVQFYATRRVGGKIADSEAIKLLATRT